jgi:hypothetical protein
MVAAVLRERLALLRQPKRAVRIAIALWIVWAVVVWNVVFDRVIVMAGRRYVLAAGLAAQAGGTYARMDDWMRPAVKNGVLMASAAAALIVLIGFCGVRLAAPRDPHARNASG